MATTGVRTPEKMANATNQGLFLSPVESHLHNIYQHTTGTQSKDNLDSKRAKPCEALTIGLPGMTELVCGSLWNLERQKQFLLENTPSLCSHRCGHGRGIIREGPLRSSFGKDYIIGTAQTRRGSLSHLTKDSR